MISKKGEQQLHGHGEDGRGNKTHVEMDLPNNEFIYVHVATLFIYLIIYLFIYIIPTQVATSACTYTAQVQ